MALCSPDREAVLVLREEDRSAPGKITNYKLISASGKSLKELDRLSKMRGLGPVHWIGEDKPPVSQPVFAWIIPRPIGSRSFLKGSDPFMGRMSAHQDPTDELSGWRNSCRAAVRAPKCSRSSMKTLK